MKKNKQAIVPDQKTLDKLDKALGYSKPEHKVEQNGYEPIFPFGKYRNAPIEVVLGDKKYCVWLLNQEWFEVDYPEFYKLIFPSVTAAIEPIVEKKPKRKIVFHNPTMSIKSNPNYCLN